MTVTRRSPLDATFLHVEDDVTHMHIGSVGIYEGRPSVPLGGHVRVGVAIYSYDGALGFGVTGDADSAPDIGVLCAGIERAMEELLAAAHP